jgi:hypothetical protein
MIKILKRGKMAENYKQINQIWKCVYRR